MSIIYDALKKVEKGINIDKVTAVDKKDSHSRSKLYLIYIIAACFSLFIGNLIFGFLGNPKNYSRGNPKQLSTIKNPDASPSKEPSSQPPLSKQQEIPSSQAQQPTISRYKKETQESLVLNGVFFSENEGYALVNNKIVKVGDVVDGATVKRISMDEVELEIDGSVFKLSTTQR